MLSPSAHVSFATAAAPMRFSFYGSTTTSLVQSSPVCRVAHCRWC